MMRTKEELKELIERNEEESMYQDFLEKNRHFIPLSFLHHHGIHFSLLFTKYPVQESYKTDFMFLTKTSGHWRAVLIEIEKPSSRIFKDGSNEFHSDYTRAKDQILNWKSRLSSKGADDVFKNNLAGIFGHMISNEIDFKYILIHGRRDEYGAHPERRRKIETDLGEDVHFMSYDSLLDVENKDWPAFLAKKVKERVHLIDYSDDPDAGDNLISWVNPSTLYATTEVKEKIKQFISMKKIPTTGAGMPTLYEKQVTKFNEFVQKLVEKEI